VEPGRLVEEGREGEVFVLRRRGVETHLRPHLVTDLLYLHHSHRSGYVSRRGSSQARKRPRWAGVAGAGGEEQGEGRG
jgi:hypothetical protein